MKCLARNRSISLLMLVLLALATFVAFTVSASQETKPKDDRGLGARPTAPSAAANQTRAGANKPEIVLQAGITSPQTQIAFSPDGRLLASMGKDGNSIKLWEVASGRVLRQLESAIPSMGASSLTRPFRFSADGRTVIAMADGRIRRWEVETGREISSTVLPGAKDLLAAFLSEDGNVFAGLDLNSSAVRIWDTTAGRELRAITFEKEERPVANDAIALSPDGKLLSVFTDSVEVSRKGAAETTLQIMVWDVASGRKAQNLKVSTAPTQFGVAAGGMASLAFSRDGSWLAMRNESTVKLWDVATGREVKSFASPRIMSGNPSDPAFLIFANKFLFSPDRRLISVVSDGRKIDLVDATSGTTLQTLAGHDGAVLGVCFSTDSKLIASSGSDNQIKLWDVATGRELRALSGAAMPVSDIAFSSDGKSLTVAGHQAVSSWELVSGGVRRAVSLPDDYGRPKLGGIQERGCTLSRDGKLVIAGSSTQSTAKVWEVATGRELPSMSLTQGKELGNAAFNSDGSVVALMEKNNQTPSPSGPQASAQAPPTTQQPIALPDMSKIMEQMRKDPKKMQEQMKKAQEAMKNGDMSAGMSVLESMGVMAAPANKLNKSVGSLRILDVASGRQLQSIPIGGGFMNDMTANSILSSATLSFSPDGRILASASGFNAPITLRDVTTGQELGTLKTTFSMSVYGLTWSADGKRLASAHWGTKRNFVDPNVAPSFSFDDLNFAIKVWDAQSGTELKSLEGHKNFVNALAFSRDGRMLASGCYDSTIKLWDLTTGSELRTLKGHAGSIAALDFSAEGRFVVSGSEDGSARLWNTQSGEMLATLVSLNKGDDKATAALEQRARERGCSDVNKYVERLIATDLLAAKSFDEILAPIRRTLQESGMSEHDLDSLFEEAREEVHQDRKAREQ